MWFWCIKVTVFWDKKISFLDLFEKYTFEITVTFARDLCIIIDEYLFSHFNPIFTAEC